MKKCSYYFGGKVMKQRIKYGIATLLLLAVEVMIALFMDDNFIRPYVGDILVVIVVYTFIRIWFPQNLRTLPLYVFLFAVGVEVLQYFQIVKVLGLENHGFFRVLIGSVFDVKDIVCYGIGCGLLEVYERRRNKY